VKRLPVTPRPDWRERVERDLGFAFHTIDGQPYWDETACYVFDAAEIDSIEDATSDIEQMALELVDRVVDAGEEAYQKLRIPPAAWEAIDGSWKAGAKNIYGRFDFSYDGKGPPRLLEYNADTPTALFEAAVVQWDWLESLGADRDQFNSIHEKLIEAWRTLGVGKGPVHFSAVAGHAEDGGTVEYLRDTATQGGLSTVRIDIEDIGWDGTQFLDLENRPITTLFKLYPWEWLVTEEFGEYLLSGIANVIEPPWKMVLSNKAALALLWEMAPGHPNLLETTFEPGGIQGEVIQKPIYGREGANVQIVANGHVLAETNGPYGAEGFVYQAAAPLPAFDGRYPVLGSWVVASRPAGMGIREDDTAITRDTSRFIPHYFE